MKNLLLALFSITLIACDRTEAMDPDTDPTMNDELYFPSISGDDWDTLSADSLGWDTSLLPDLESLLQDGDTRAFLLLKDGKIVLEYYYGKDLLGLTDFNKDRMWYWASAGKTLTGFTIGKAQEDGFLSINEPSNLYLGAGWSSLTSDQENNITIKNHLTMTTGLDDGVTNSDNTDPENLQFKSDAGTRWAYHNAPYTILDQVVESAVGEDFDSYFETVLADKIGMEGMWSWVGDNHVYFSTPRSMARFGLLISNKGKWENTVIMDDTDFIDASVTVSQDINKSYGYLWWLNGQSSYMVPGLQLQLAGSLLPDAPNDMYSGLGKNGQYISIVPSENLVLVRMGDNPDQSLVPITYQNDIWKILNEMRK